MGRFKDRIDARFHRQEQKGVEKYGQPLEQNHGNYDYRLEHLAEELTDGLMYCEWLKESGKTITTMFELMAKDFGNIRLSDGVCPIDKDDCPPEYKNNETCVACLQAHYEEKAREKICSIP